MKNLNDSFKWNRLEGVRITSDYDMPIVDPVNDVHPRNLVSFNNAKYCIAFASILCLMGFMNWSEESIQEQ